MFVDRSETTPSIWRRVRVSGGLSLSPLADKILTPLMGFTRNYHCHVFTDFKDGAQFGPKGCQSVDMMHIDKVRPHLSR